MPASLKRKMEMKNDPEIQRKKVSGRILIANSAKGKEPKPVVLFIFARPKGQKSGPPLAVKRISNVLFPFQYSIGQVDTMMEGTNFSGEVQITARLDADGLAGASAGDLEGKAEATVGSENIDIILGFSSLKQVKTPGAISGTLDLKNGIKNNLPKHPYLFIYVRPEGASKNSPPLAVKRIEGVTFPYDFSISKKDSMIAGTKFEGNVILTARLDLDGDARPMPGDIEGEVLSKTGKNNVHLILDRVIGDREARNKNGDKINTITGIISVSPEIEKQILNRPDRMFIILREKGNTDGLPLAVQLHKKVNFPFNYKIGQQDAMIPGTKVNGNVEVIVRIDRDGNAKSSPGDLEGGAFAKMGDGNVNIVLNKKI